jgi:hypothetical protein
MCVQKEERIKEACDDSINHVKHNKKKNFSNSPQRKKSYSHDNKASSSKGKAPMKEHDHVPKGVYRHCKRERQYMKDCVKFLKWLNMHGKNKYNDLITSIDESLYLDYLS